MQSFVSSFEIIDYVVREVNSEGLKANIGGWPIQTSSYE